MLHFCPLRIWALYQGPRSIFAIGGAIENVQGIFSARRRRKRPIGGSGGMLPRNIFKINASRLAKNSSQYSRHSEFRVTAAIHQSSFEVLLAIFHRNSGNMPLLRH